MQRGIILVSILPGMEREVYQEIRDSQNNQKDENRPIVDVNLLLGEYDLMVYVDANSEEEFLDTMLDLVRVKGVKDTSTLTMLPREYLQKKFSNNNP